MLPDYQILNASNCTSAVLALYEMMKQTAELLDKLKAAIVKNIEALKREE